MLTHHMCLDFLPSFIVFLILLHRLQTQEPSEHVSRNNILRAAVEEMERAWIELAPWNAFI